MAIDGRKAGPTPQNASPDDIRLDELQLVAPEGIPATPSRRPGAAIVSKGKAAHPIPGVEVTEFEATLPIEIYGELFKDHR